jgi:hypothetical protein
MGVKVDKTGRHDLAGRVDRASGTVSANGGFHSGDSAVLDCHVVRTNDSDARINHFSAGDHDIVFSWRRNLIVSIALVAHEIDAPAMVTQAAWRPAL